MVAQPFIWTINQTAMADGTVSITFPTPPTGLCWSGSVFVGGATAGSFWEAFVGFPGGGTLWGQWIGASTYQPIQVYSGLTLTMVGKLLVAGTVITATFAGTSDDLWNSALVGPGQIAFTGAYKTQTFTADGSIIVPAGVSFINVDVVAGSGTPNGIGGTLGGRGGRVQATIPVVQGETLTVKVGNAGGNGTGGASSYAAGGNPGSANTGNKAGGGGGASAIERGSTALVVAGGGGGGVATNFQGDYGGAGGGLTGGTGVGTAGRVGTGGTPSAGGTGGTASGAGATNGANGTQSAGGAGGSAATGAGSGDGGGGGGGWWGGGGGGGSTKADGTAGGGSSYTDASLIGVTHTQGYWPVAANPWADLSSGNGNGYVAVSMVVP